MSIDAFIQSITISPIHLSFAQMIERRTLGDVPLLFLAAMITSDQSLRGHVCVPFDDELSLSWPSKDNPDEMVTMPKIDWHALCEEMSQSPMVACVEGSESINEIHDVPLVCHLPSKTLYLGRYWYFERELARLIHARLNQSPVSIDQEVLRENIDRLYPQKDKTQYDQIIAAAHTMDRAFSVVAGGPGTGKTTTLSAVLVMRLNQFLQQGMSKPRILLMAPTGKAAQRLNESLRQALLRLDLNDQEKEALSDIKAGTIHRLLGWTPMSPEKGGPFKHDVKNPLLADIVVVDESSMVDIGLMYRLVSALRKETQIVLVGDPDQLASVEAGCVLGDLCRHSTTEILDYLPAPRVSVLADRTGLKLISPSAVVDDPLRAAACFLRFSHRFNESSPVGHLARAMREGNDVKALKVLNSNQQQIQWQQASGLDALLDEAVSRYRKLVDMIKQQPFGTLEQLQALSDYRVLCAHHEGERGDLNINQRIHRRLFGSKVKSGSFPVGTPVMVTANNYQLNLYNGDLGMVVRNPANGETYVAFEEAQLEDAGASDGLRRVPLVLLQDIVLCYAMSIHKSQGSEFHRLAIVLPDAVSPILTRELIYTGITRMCDREGKSGQISLYASKDVLKIAIQEQVRRSSGLRNRIQDDGQ